MRGATGGSAGHGHAPSGGGSSAQPAIKPAAARKNQRMCSIIGFRGLERASSSEFRVVDHPARSGTRPCARRVPRVVDAAAQAGKRGPRSALVQHTGYRQRELGNRCVELGTVFGHHLVAEDRSEEHTSELQSPYELVCRLLLEK